MNVSKNRSETGMIRERQKEKKNNHDTSREKPLHTAVYLCKTSGNNV